MADKNLLSLRVSEIRSEAMDVKSFCLVSAQGEALPTFTPGSHIDVHIRPGLIRQYSLCGSAADTSQYIIGVKREPMSRGGSEAMHDLLKVGDELSVSVPRNNFPLSSQAKDHLLIAGGIGVTPLLAMAHHLTENWRDFQLHYFVRSREHAAFKDVILSPPFIGRCSLHEGLTAEETIASLNKILGERAQDKHLYVCGPKPFMDAVLSIASASQWPTESIHLEYFAFEAAVFGNERRFTVELARRGTSCEVLGNQSIVEALHDHGVEIEVSCEQGVCGTCLTRVLSGTPDHRDVFLTDAEKAAGDRMTLCVSRALSERIVLDI